MVDASVVAVAERLGEATIATLDHRHFSVVRPRHVASFTLVPSLLACRRKPARTRHKDVT